jgi:hypothetical protein
MCHAVNVEIFKCLECLLEDAAGHPERIANLHSSLARCKLWQSLYHGVHTRAHRFKYQTGMETIGAMMDKLVEKLYDMLSLI